MENEKAKTKRSKDVKRTQKSLHNFSIQEVKRSNRKKKNRTCTKYPGTLSETEVNSFNFFFRFLYYTFFTG